MSDYHILSQAADKKTIQVVFHYAVPTAGKNAADLLYTDIVQKCCDLTSQLPDFATEFATEYAAMQAGEVIERQEGIRFSSTDLTAAQKKEQIENAYGGYKTAELSRLQNEWEWYGYDGNV